MTRKYFLTALFLFAFLPFSQAKVEIIGNAFYIDGKKFFIKGIGYEIGALPGYEPNNRVFDEVQITYDLERIKRGGFNTIRTWGALSEDELTVVQNSGLKLLMGVWIDPHCDFSLRSNIEKARKTLKKVLAYSRNYDCIIGYLLMNEPLASDIVGNGYPAAVNLWSQLVELVHEYHPGVPASIANTPCGTMVDPDIFDFNAYNNYSYNPVTIDAVHGYQAFTEYVQRLSSSSLPLVVTEFGLSVSPSGTGGYGGNSTAQQADGDVSMYRDLVNGGAMGACVFNYSDGWYKAGDAYTHDDTAEEWFGLVEYESNADHEGTERPAWGAVRDFQSCIITSPRSQEIYTGIIPVECFLNDTVSHVELLDESGRQLWLAYNSDNYICDILYIAPKVVEDKVLTFNCYDNNHQLIKTEEKIILLANQYPRLPSISIVTNANMLSQHGKTSAIFDINRSSPFDSSKTLWYAWYPHDGFGYGEKHSAVITNKSSLETSYMIGSNVIAMTVAAAFDAVYGKFVKRIYNQLTVVKDQVFVDDIELSEESIEGCPGDTLRLTASVFPETAYHKRVSWHTSDPQVAIVDAYGLVTILAPGNAEISAEATDGSGITACCNIHAGGSRASSANADHVSVIFKDRDVQITGLHSGMKVGCYDISGIPYQSFMASSQSASFSLPPTGIYVLKISNKCWVVK